MLSQSCLADALTRRVDRVPVAAGSIVANGLGVGCSPLTSASATADWRPTRLLPIIQGELRGPEPLDTLFPKARRQVLGTLMLDANRGWSLSDIAKHHGTTPSTLQRELAALQECGLLLRYELGGRVLYRANAGCAHFPELQALFVKAFSFGDLLRDSLEPLSIRSAFVYGNTVWGDSLSPIHLVVVASVAPEALDMALRPLEIRMGRQIEAALLSEGEFADRLQAGEYFLRTTLESTCLTVVGDDFAAAA